MRYYSQCSEVLVLDFPEVLARVFDRDPPFIAISDEDEQTTLFDPKSGQQTRSCLAWFEVCIDPEELNNLFSLRTAPIFTVTTYREYTISKYSPKPAKRSYSDGDPPAKRSRM